MVKTVPTGAEYLQDCLEKVASMMREARGKTQIGGWKYFSTEELVLKEGKLLSNEPFTEEEEVTLLRLFKAAPGPYKTKQCYYNAMLLMFRETASESEI